MIKLGEGVIKELRLGDKEIKKAYLGSTVVYEKEAWYIGSGSKELLLTLSFNDDISPDGLTYRYRWDGDKTYVEMLQDICAVETRLVFLVQLVGEQGYILGGIGYHATKRTLLNINFDLTTAMSSVSFTYPNNAANLARTAINKGKNTGIIYHPFNAESYTNAARDFDYWQGSNSTMRFGCGENLKRISTYKEIHPEGWTIDLSDMAAVENQNNRFVSLSKPLVDGLHVGFSLSRSATDLHDCPPTEITYMTPPN